jgi:hypothetical protein
MPRGMKHQKVVEPVIVDEVQDPQVEEALNHAELVEPSHDEKWAAIDAEFAETNEAERPTTALAPHARDFDWATMRWNPAKTKGNRLCLCNRIAGGECELTTKSRFSIGHDARFKGILQTAWRAGQKVRFTFETDDQAVVVNPLDGSEIRLEGEYELEADAIARLVAPKLLPHITHISRQAKLQKLDAEAGTTVPQTAVEGKPDAELTDADVDAQVDDAAGADVEFVEL